MPIVNVYLSDETIDKLERLKHAINFLTDNNNSNEDIIKAALANYLERFYSKSDEEIKEKVIPLSSNFPLKNKIGKYIKKRSILPSDLADQLKISKGTMSNIINNKHQPSLNIFIRIWIMLGCPPLYELLYRDFSN